MEELKLRDEFIKLGQAMKAAGIVSSGIDAKMLIQDGQVTVNGEVETRRGKKLYDGDVFEFEGEECKITIREDSMFVESIELNNYRNFDSLKVEFSPGVNIFFGDNAQGKTNLLESIYVSGTLRSHRGSRDKDLIRFGEDEAHIRLFFRKDSLSHRLDVHLKKNKSKGVAVDGVPVRRSGELLGMMHIVFFSPEDLSIIKEGPAGRRRFLDMELSQIDKGYMQQLVAYSKILNERNNLLKQINLYPALIDTLDGWDEQLLAAGQFLIKKREEFVYFLDEMMAKIHGQLTGGKEQIKVEYEKNVEAEKFREQLYSKRNKDISSGTTSVGPHRDDLRFKVGGIDIRKFGSQGQQRTAALSLKLSEIRLIEQVTGEKPILLLDDVLSELDAGRQSWLLESIQDIQTLISCTGLDDFVNSRISLDKVFRVKEGIVQEEKTDGLV